MAGVRGQGRKFAIDHALDVAMDQFWEHGYEGTSVSSLIRAIGISAPSLYAAFGDKRQLFDSVVAHYLRGAGGWMARAFDEERCTPALVRRLLSEAASRYLDPEHPRGCLIIVAGSCVSAANAEVSEALRQHRNHTVATLVERFEQGLAAGDVPPDLNSAAAAEFVAVTVQGISTRARDGAAVDELLAAAELACRALGIDRDRAAAAAGS